MKNATMEQFTDMNMIVIDGTISDLMRVKNGDQTLTTFDMMSVTTKVKNIYRLPLKDMPPQIEAACGFAMAVVDPSAAGRIKTLKHVLSVVGGSAGIGMIIAGVGGVLGWGAGIITTVVTFFTGAAVAGPIGWIAGGIGVTAIAGYFALHKNDSSLSQKAIKVLKEGITKAIPPVWAEHEAVLREYEYSQSTNGPTKMNQQNTENSAE